MKIKHGGYTPRIDGRPAEVCEDTSAVKKIRIMLQRNGVVYTPVIKSGESVKTGASVAKAKIGEGEVFLPAPCTGTAVIRPEGEIAQIDITDIVPDDSAGVLRPVSLAGAGRGELVEALCRGGAWQYFWSYTAGGTPDPTGGKPPAAIVINSILTEPFRARGSVVVSRCWDSIVQGIRFLQHLIEEYGKIEIIFVAPAKSPLAKKMYTHLKGFAWVRFHDGPLCYPIENPSVLIQELMRTKNVVKTGGDIWVVDVQGVRAIGDCLGNGIPPGRRIIGIGGPGEKNPRHVEAGIGTSWASFMDTDTDSNLLLRGGLINGTVREEEQQHVGWDDDAIFVLPKMVKGEFLTFLRPGFNRTSYSRTFVSSLTGGADRHITNSLRGEVRPCIACGLCEKVCPVEIMPQILHRYLYRAAVDEAERAGLFKCVDCNLCTFICPSKIELQDEFKQAREQILSERAELQEEI